MPVTRGYERRIAELTGHVHALSEQIQRIQAAEAARPKPWVPLGHYYSPIPDIDDIHRRYEAIFGGDPLDLPGIDLDLDRQWQVHRALAPLAADIELASDADEAAARGDRYWADNPSLGPADGLALTLVLRHHRPARLVELGSGFSSACMLDARDRYLDGRLDLTFVDPYMGQFDELLHERDRDPGHGSFTRLPVGTQDVDLEVFRQLGAGDVLFVDSTHVARTGSDVNRIFFGILPALAPGVLVHVHDVFPGFEYPVPWVLERRGWTEQYVLRAFLQYNSAFRVHWWPTLLHAVADADERARHPELERLVGGSIWLEATG